MPTMNVNLTSEMAAYVTSEIASGDYVSSSELVRDALRLLRFERDMEREKLAVLRHEIGLAIAQADRGEFSTKSVMEMAAEVLAEDEA